MAGDGLLPVEARLAAFVTRVLDELLAQFGDEAAVRGALASLGVEGADADVVATYVAGQAQLLAQIADDLPELLRELGRVQPDLVGKVAPQAWSAFRSITAITAESPALELPGLPDAGTVLDTLLAAAVDRTLQGRTPAAWASLKALQLVGPELPVFAVVDQVLDSPTGFLWRRLEGLRRHLDITISGILTGPRTVSVVTIPVTSTDRVPDAVQAAVPEADLVLQRVTLRLAADTYDEPHPITFEVLGHDPGNDGPPEFAAVTVVSTPVAGPVAVSSAVSLDLAPLTHPFGVALTGWGSVVPITEGRPTLRLASAFAGGFSFGSDALRLTAARPTLEPRIDATDWGLRAGFEELELVLGQTIAGDLLAMLLPRDGIRIRGKLMVVADEQGLHLEGGVGLTTTWPDTLRLPGLLVRGMTTEIRTDDAGFTLAAAGTVTVDLGVLTITIEGLGLEQSLALRPDGTGNLGLLDLGEPTGKQPTGAGISIDAGVVKGGGLLRIEDGRVSGALELALTLGTVELAIRAVGVLEEVDGQISFVVVMSVEFTPAIELFLGLTLNAVGGVFGLNRTVDPDALTATVRGGRMDDVMFPRDLATRAVEVIDTVKQVFPARGGQVVAGPMLKLGWGRPESFVTASVGVVFTFPDPVVIAIIGTMRIALPRPELPLIDIRADFSGVINASTGDVSFDASLTNSRIATFDVTGDLALRAGPSGFLFTAGGFCPGFPVPATLGPVRRLAISIAPSPVLSIRADAYFALTPSTVQLGGGLAVVAELGPIGARGNLNLDVLIRTNPTLAFTANLNGTFRLSFEGADVLSAKLDVLLEGPGRWHARAHAEISFLLISASGTLELSWGSADHEPQPAEHVADLVLEALEEPPVWAQVLPAADSGTVVLAPGASALHPLGRLRLTQTVAPLGVPLAHFGSATVLGPALVTVEVTSGLTTAQPAEELFAPAQFLELSDEEKISKPPFVPMPAGQVLEGSAWSVGDTKTVEIVYEESNGDERLDADSRVLGHLREGFLDWAVIAAAGRARSERVPVPGPLADLHVGEPTYTLVDAATGRDSTLPDHGLGAFAASTRESVDVVAVASYERIGLIP